MSKPARYLVFHTLVLFLSPAIARADGGAMLFSKQSDGYRITLFAAPTSLRAGRIDFSVLLQSADSDVPLLDVPVSIHVYPANQAAKQLGGSLTSAAATNKLFRAIQLDLSRPGAWHVEVEVHDPARLVRVDCDLEVGPPLPSWIDMALWIGWPSAAIVLFVIHQQLVRRHRIGA